MPLQRLSRGRCGDPAARLSTRAAAAGVVARRCRLAAAAVPPLPLPLVAGSVCGRKIAYDDVSCLSLGTESYTDRWGDSIEFCYDI